MINDYKGLKLLASSNPHIRSNEDTRSLMLDVIIALVPAMAVAVWQFGLKALLLIAVSVAACVFFEWLYRKLMKKSSSIGDLSACVTGVLIALASFCLSGAVRHLSQRERQVFPPLYNK